MFPFNQIIQGGPIKRDSRPHCTTKQYFTSIIYRIKCDILLGYWHHKSRVNVILCGMADDYAKKIHMCSNYLLAYVSKIVFPLRINQSTGLWNRIRNANSTTEGAFVVQNIYFITCNLCNVDICVIHSSYKAPFFFGSVVVILVRISQNIWTATCAFLFYMIPQSLIYYSI